MRVFLAVGGRLAATSCHVWKKRPAGRENTRPVRVSHGSGDNTPRLFVSVTVSLILSGRLQFDTFPYNTSTGGSIEPGLGAMFMLQILAGPHNNGL